jgi:hypothetical protein
MSMMSADLAVRISTNIRYNGKGILFAAERQADS